MYYLICCIVFTSNKMLWLERLLLNFQESSVGKVSREVFYSIIFGGGQSPNGLRNHIAHKTIGET